MAFEQRFKVIKPDVRDPTDMNQFLNISNGARLKPIFASLALNWNERRLRLRIETV